MRVNGQKCLELRFHLSKDSLRETHQWGQVRSSGTVYEQYIALPDVKLGDTSSAVFDIAYYSAVLLDRVIGVNPNVTLPDLMDRKRRLCARVVAFQ